MLPEDSQNCLKQLPVLRKGVDLSKLSKQQSLTRLPCAHHYVLKVGLDDLSGISNLYDSMMFSLKQ